MNDIREELGNLRDDVVEHLESLAQRPLLRGISHLIAFFVSIALGVVLIVQATAAMQLVSSIVYSVGLTLALGTSAIYHRVRWKPRAKAFMRKLDHSMIFVLVASSYTPLLLLALDGGWRITSLAVIWVLASGGIIMRLAIPNLPRVARVASYIGIGWVAVLLLPKLYGVVYPTTFMLLVITGVLYSIGAIVYLYRRPDPLPRIFGFHEIFHMLVIAAAGCHYAAVYPLLVGPVHT